MELKGKTALITGASGRLGSVIALSLAAAGCRCVCHHYSEQKKAEELVEQIENSGSKAIAVGADLTDPNQIEHLFEQAGRFADLQILINCAAVFSRQELDEVRFEDAQKIIALNLTASILTSRLFAGRLKKKYGQSDSVLGKIINISDVGGIRPWAGYVVYCSSKAGLIGATKALAKELAPTICVNSIAPGIVSLPDDFNEEAENRQLSLIPMRRIGTPQEIAAAVKFLLESDYISGQVLCIDGGRSI